MDIDMGALPYFAHGEVDPNGPVRHEHGVATPCWVWNGKRKSRNGYGRVRVGGKERDAARAIYEKMRGSIPAGLILDHRCRNVACVNPYHMEPVTRRENTQRGAAVLFKKPEAYVQRINERLKAEPVPGNKSDSTEPVIQILVLVLGFAIAIAAWHFFG